MKKQIYCGIHNDHHGGMTRIGTIIRDAWVFGIIPESETCDNWTFAQLQVIHDKTQGEWDKYGCLASNLPEDLKKRHAEIHQRAMEKARSMGWDPELDDDD